MRQVSLVYYSIALKLQPILVSLLEGRSAGILSITHISITHIQVILKSELPLL